MDRWLWKQVCDFGPPARGGHQMVYDAGRDKVVLFGGADSARKPLQDTWEWDGSTWQQMQDMGPGARIRGTMCYDSQRRRIVLFGGSDRVNLLRDTWEYDGELWVQVADEGPPAMNAPTLAFDERHGYSLLYGAGGTWQWSGTDWTQVAEVGPRTGNGIAAYDGELGAVVLVAGTAAGPGQALMTPANTTWLWNGAKWVQSSEMGPSFSTPSGGCLAWDGARLVLYESETCRTWGRNASTWIQRQSFGPAAAFDPTMVGDLIRKRCVLFGGQNGAGPPSSETWVLTIAAI